MFGYRRDGRKIKNVAPFFKVIPHIMKKRNDSQVYYAEDIQLKYLDEYINQKQEEGIKISYMNIIYAAIVRTISQRPRMNRFVINGRVYARKDIYVSLAIKKGMSDEADETTLKIPFNGTENIFEIKEKLENKINENKDEKAQNNTDILAKTLSIIPNWMMRIFINLVIFLDNHGMIPKFVLDASPFHTSAFLTNVGSIGIDTIYHHLYNFGTTSAFIAMGRKKKSYINDEENLIEEKSMSLAFVLDERICDGYYYASSIRLMKRYLKNPALLEENVEKIEDVK